MEVTPNALHGEILSGVHPEPRKITIEQAVMHQVDRIGYLRSIGEEWAESLFHLRDLIVGMEDEEFWSGIPKGLIVEDEEEREEYEKRGWNGIPVRMKRTQIGKKEFIDEPDPMPVELSQMLRIIMALLARRGMTWRRKNYDEIKGGYTTDADVSDD